MSFCMSTGPELASAAHTVMLKWRSFSRSMCWVEIYYDSLVAVLTFWI